MLYVTAFIFYVIGIFMMFINRNEPNAMGMLSGAPYVLIGLVCNGISLSIVVKSSRVFGKILIGFGLFLLFVSVIPIIAVIVFMATGGW
ncbi:MAG: hypothetical protein ACFE9R_00845 [Candidatus Hermodarchaeota archaeon]